MSIRSSKCLTIRFNIEQYGNANFIEPITRLESALARKPCRLHIDLVGSGEMSPDSALLIRSILNGRSERTHIITNARSSLQGPAVLVWLLGDTRIIREDARLFFRPASSAEGDDSADEKWHSGESSHRDSLFDDDLEEADYRRILQLIDDYLPVKELAGRTVSVALLRQFGLVDNEKVDKFLAAALARTKEPPRAAMGIGRRKASEQPRIPNPG